MMEHAQPIEPVSNASNEAVAKSKPRDTTASLFSLQEEAMETPDLSFSNCSDKPALTLVLPDDSTTPLSVEDADDESALSLTDEEVGAIIDDAADSSDEEDDAASVELEDSTESLLEKNLTHVESAARADLPSSPVEPVSSSTSSAIISTADLRPISRPSRFILPDETPAVPLPSLRTEISKPAPPVFAPAAIAPPVSVATPAPSVLAPQAAPEKKTPPPVRVGSGQLQPNRINWKPGEPFGDSAAAATRFRWELMLTTACGTAACGLAGIWLLRTLLS